VVDSSLFAFSFPLVLRPQRFSKSRRKTMYTSLYESLSRSPKTWLVTGVAGFIGSNLLEALLKLDQTVIGLDSFSTGYGPKLDEVRQIVSPETV
jgi:hypothetical protein